MEPENREHARKKFLLDILYWAVILALIYLAFKYLLNLMMPFVLAFIFAAVVRPISRFLSKEERLKKNAAGERVLVRRKFRMSRNLAGVLSVLVLFLIFGGIITLISIRLGNAITKMVEAIPALYFNTIAPGLTAFLVNVEEFASRFDESIQEAVRQAIPNLVTSVGSAVTNFSAKAVGWITSMASRVPSLLFQTVICLIATVFIAVDFDRIKEFTRRNLPAKPLQMANKIKDAFLDIIWQFLKSYFLIFLITTTEITVGLLIIGVKSPLLIGLIVALFDAFPIVGSGMILLPWATVTLLTGNVVDGVGLALLYVTVVVARQFIEPKIIGKRIGLRPIATLICMFAGTKLFGVIGLFGLPIAAAILVNLNDNGSLNLFKHTEPAPCGEKTEPSGGEN